MTILLGNVINIAMQKLSLQFHLKNDLIFIDKPAGLSTHAPDTERQGLAELLQQELNQKIYVVHRLDKTTTGAMVFATTEQKAQELFADFKNHKVQKKYYFITESQTTHQYLQCFSQIKKNGNSYLNEICAEKDANAKTVFRRIKINARFQWWEALPTTGKPHQIRLHARQMGIPILGDSLYGGAPFPHLCLHSFELTLPGLSPFQCPPPLFFERMGLLRDPYLCALLASFDRRQRLYGFLQKPDQSLRLVHTEIEPLLPLRMDSFGEILWLYWYGQTDPSKDMMERFEFISGLLRRPLIVRQMQNRGKDSSEKKQWSFGEVPSSWMAKENGLSIEMRTNQGLSPGLFLDQRENRNWLQATAANKKVLNLFSYTCGFSLAAAVGEAKEVISVDLSKAFLEWGKKNFEINNLNPSDFQFFAMDSIKFLKNSLKNNRFFDIIICDPPSFSRSANGVFQIEKQFKALIELCLSCLNPGGKLLFSTNYEKWSQQDLESQARHLKNSQLLKKLACGLDFELPGTPPLMKFILIEKNKKL